MKMKPVILCAIAAFSASAFAQSLSDYERINSQSNLLASCENLIKKGGSDEACKHLRVEPEAGAEKTVHEKKSYKSAATTIEVVAYKAVEVRGVLDRVAEVLVDGQTFRMRVGDIADNFRLERLTDYQAEFVQIKQGRPTGTPRIISFRTPSAPAVTTSQARVDDRSSPLQPGMPFPPLPVGGLPLPTRQQ